MPKIKPNTTYAQMGMAALLPGMQHMLELMQAHLDEFRLQLAGMQDPEHRPVGRPPNAVRAAAGKSGWPDDPAERSAEMKRRMAVARQKRKEPSALSKERKAAWAKLSPKERKARLAAMMAGRQKAPTVKLQVAS